MTQKPGTDRNALLAMALSFLVLFAAMGIRMSFGAYVTAWEKTFAVTRADVSLISSVSFLLFALATPLAGKMIDRHGSRLVFTTALVLIGVGLIASSFAKAYWQLLFFYGVVTTVGFAGASSLTTSVAVMKWFPNRQGFAVGVVSCGIAAGGMIIAPLTVYQIENLGWRQVILFLGLICLLALSLLVWLFLKDAPAPTHVLEDGRAKAGKGSESGGLRWIYLMTLAIGVPYFICGFTDHGLFSTHFVPLAEGRGISTGVIALALSLDAAVNLGGNLLAGYLADRMSLTLLLGGMYLWRAGALIFLLFAGDSTSILVFAALNGAVEASTIAPTAALCSKVYGPGRMGAFFGIVSAAHQFGGAAGAFLIGALFSRTKDYATGITASALLLVLACAITLYSGWIIGRKRMPAPVTR